MFGSKLTKALTAALQDPTSAAEKIQSVSKEKVRTAGEAELVAQVLTLFPLPPGASAKRAVGSALHDVVAWFQGAEAEEAVAVFRQRGAAELLRIFDEAMARASVDWRTKDDLLFLLKIVCMYGAEGAWSGWCRRCDPRCFATATCGRSSSASSPRRGIRGRSISLRHSATRCRTSSQAWHTWT